MNVVIAIDAGTTGVRSFAVGEDGAPRGHSYREFPQHFPQPGWVEHDAEDIWRVTLETLDELCRALGERGDNVAAIGITNQRETVVVWDRRSGRPRHRAIVWQDRRTAGRCDELRDAGREPLVRRSTGLVLDPYFSGTKLEWLFANGVGTDSDLAFGTVDSWILWNLTGGPEGGVHATDPSNASRTMLFDLATLAWSPELCDLFGVPASCLPTVLPSSGRFGMTVPERAAGLRVPVSGIAGDQQAALFGQACFTPGMCKNTYGTGSFVLQNVGAQVPEPAEGLLTTVAWTLADGTTAYAMEGAVFVTGAAIQWMRDGIEIIAEAAETGPLAASVPDTGGVYVVPAFTGLGSPWWDPYARGAVLGITRGTGRAHIARAVVESIAWQTRDVVDAIAAASGTRPAEMRVDGGASVMDLLLQLQADVLGVTVQRSAVAETTALGAAYLAGIAEQVWESPDAVSQRWRHNGSFGPAGNADDIAARHTQWLRAVERARGWATD